MSTREATATVPPGASASDGEGEGLVDLIRQLTNQGSHLAGQQLALVQAEVRESANDVKAAIGGMIGAAVVGIAGLGVLLMGFAYLLAEAIESLALGTLIVGAVAVIVALILYITGRRKIDATQFSPDRSIRTLERTPEIVRGKH